MTQSFSLRRILKEFVTIIIYAAFTWRVITISLEILLSISIVQYDEVLEHFSTVRSVQIQHWIKERHRPLLELIWSSLNAVIIARRYLPGRYINTRPKFESIC